MTKYESILRLYHRGYMSAKKAISIAESQLKPDEVEKIKKEVMKNEKS